MFVFVLFETNTENEVYVRERHFHWWARDREVAREPESRCRALLPCPMAHARRHARAVSRACTTAARTAKSFRALVPGRYDDAAQHHDTTTRRQRNRHHQRQSSPTAQTRHTSRHAPPARPAVLCSCHRRWPMPMPRPPLSQPPPSPARRRSHQVHRRRTYFRDRARCFAAGVK